MTRSAPAEPEGRSGLVRVATVGAAHGLSGQVRLRLHTDNPQQRLVRGARLSTEPAVAGPLTVTMVRQARQEWFAKFDGVGDRDSAEALRGVLLLAQEDTAEDDAWYPRQLRGLRVDGPDGVQLGVIEDIQHLPAQDVLVVRETAGERTLVPFVSQMVTVVDLPGGRVVIDPPPGLLSQDHAPPYESGGEERS